MEDKTFDGKRVRSSSFTYGKTGTAAFPANRSVDFNGKLIQPLSKDLNKKIRILTFRELAKGKNISSGSIDTIARSGNEGYINFASSIIETFPQLLAIKILETYCKENYSAAFEQYLERVKGFEGFGVKAALLVDAYGEFTKSGQSITSFFTFFEKVPYGKIAELFKVLEEQKFSEEASAYIVDVIEQDFGQRNEDVALTYIKDLAKDEEVKRKAFSLLKDQGNSSGEHLLKIYKSFSFDVKKIDEKIKFIENKKKDAAKSLLTTTIGKGKTDERDLLEKFQDQELLKEIANSFADKLSKEDSKLLTSSLSRNDKKDFDRLKRNDSLKTNNSFALKIKWIAEYEKGLGQRIKDDEFKKIDDSSLFYEQALEELYKFLEAVAYNELSFDVLTLVDNNYKDAEVILNTVDSAILNQLLKNHKFNKSQISLFASCQHKKELAETFTSLSKTAIDGFMRSGKRLGFLEKLISAAISIDLINDISKDLELVDDLLDKHTDALLDVFSHNKKVSDIRLAKNEQFWLTFDVACVVLLKSNDKDVKEVFSLLKKLNNNIGYSPNDIDSFLSTLADNRSLSDIKGDVNKWIFEQVKNEVGQVIKIKKDTLMSPKGKTPYRLDHDIMETGNRFLNKNGTDFKSHLRKIDYLLEQNHITVTVTNWQFEKVGLEKSDFTVECGGQQIAKYTMHRHPGASKASVGSAESSNLHFKPTDSSNDRYKDGGNSIPTLWNKRK